MVWTRLTRGSEHGLKITAAAWIHSHSDVVVAAASLELAEPPPSKTGHVKTKTSLSGDLTAHLVLSSHFAPCHDSKPFLTPNEAVSPAAQCPWRSALLSLGKAPQISSSPPRNSPLHQRNPPAAGLAHLHGSSWSPCNDTKHQTWSSGANSEANVTVQFQFCVTTHHWLPQTAMRWRVGTLPWSVLYRHRTHRHFSPTKPLPSPRNTFALDSVLLHSS